MDESWFLKWFNSPYYDLLYRHRSEGEAKAFLEELLKFLKPPIGSKMLDVACGNGRYSIYLADKGYDVTGIDISNSKIQEASESTGDHLQFYRHDMRLPFRKNHFDYVFNFFTSFGYFERDEDHDRTIASIRDNLKVGGCFLLDYMNTPKVIEELVEEEERELDGIHFSIKRYVENNFIVKKIEIHHRNRDFEFIERVRAFYLEDFQQMLADNGLELKKYFGDYRLGEYVPSQSDRLILLAKKTN